MAGTPFCLVLLCLIWEATAFETHITKPISCSRDEVRFHRGHQYLYHYSTTVETTFVGTTASKSAFKLDCEIKVEARRKCEAYMKVTMCSLYRRQPGEGDIYIKDKVLSTDITRLLRRELYFQFGRGTIRPHTIVVKNTETNDALNIKRGMLSALQIKLITEEPGDQIHTMETDDLFGSCPTKYVVKTSGKILTSRDIARCQVPHYSYQQNNLFSMIKRMYGGYLQSDIDELTYPFNSTIKCEHAIGEKHKLEETKCLQQQQFRPFAREGDVISTCMTNISQHLILQETRDLANRNINRKMRGKKSTSLMYEFDIHGMNIRVNKDDISHWLHKLNNQNNTMESYPKLFHEFVWFLKQAQTNTLLEVMTDVWDCHGNHGNYCNRTEQRLEQDYFLDGLLSCGTEACIGVFTNAMKAGHIHSWLGFLFLYDLALNHRMPSQIAKSLLDMCKEQSRGSCWFPMSIMIRNIATAGGSVEYMESGPVYQTLYHIRKTIGDKCVTGISQNLNQSEKQHIIDELLLMIKVVGNIGAPVQNVYDSKYTGMEGEAEDRRLVHALLQCAYNTDLPHKVAKAAILALHKMTFTPKMKDVLISILTDVNRPPSVRTTIFAELVMQSDRDLAAGLLELIHTEKMDYMRNYMITYVKSLLQNDQPDLQGLRSIWKELVNEDPREFPHARHWFGWTKYIEMSRYMKFPIRMEYLGFQIELDTVYNIASPVVNAVVLRINYFDGQKFNLLELAADIDELHVIVDAIKTFPLPRSQGNVDSRREGTVFDTLQKNIAAAILGLFDKMNLSQTKVPDGLIHVKVLGKELFYLEVRDLLTIISQSRSRQSFQNIAIGYLHEMLQQLPMHRASSTSLMDMVKILPTVAGFPLNMTVSAAMNMGLHFDARLTMPDILNLNADVQLDTSLKTHASVQLNGELTTRFGQHSLSGARASFRGLVKMSVVPSLRFNTQPNPPTELDISLSQSNTDSNYTVASLSGHLYLMHQSGEMEVEADPEFQTTVQDCDRGILSHVTGNQVCFISVFPNTTSSTRHAYFPLSGPFHFSLDTRKVDTETIHMSVLRSRNGSDRHFWINVTRQGQENTDGLILHIHRKDRFTLMELIMPSAQIHLYVKEGYTWFYESLNPTNYWIYDMHLSVSGRSLIRFLVQVQYHRNLTKKRRSIISLRDIVDVTLAIPGASLAVRVNYFRNRSNNHYNTAINITYHCIKARPLLYLLHWNPTLAAQNGDVSVTQVVNDVIIGYTDDNSLWRANDYMLLKLPGLKISLDNKMEVNVTNASRHTVIVYTGMTGQEHTIIMDAHVTNRTNITDNNYAYFMLLSHSGMPYNLSVRGHLKGVNQNLNLLTEIEKVSKTEQESSAVEGSNTEGNEISNGAESCMETPGRTVLTLTLVGVPVSEGIEMRWDGNYSRQVCGGQVLYRTTGVYGQLHKNTRMNFHYWGTLNVTVAKSRDAVGQQEAVFRSKSYRGNFRFRFQYFEPIHIVLGYSSHLVNTSYILHFYQIPKERHCLLIHCQLQTEWPAINFNIRNLYSWTDHLVQETEVTSAWLDVTTEAYYNIKISSIDLKINHIIDSRMPWLPGRTNITGHFVANGVLPELLVTLERSKSMIALKAVLINSTLGIITVTFQKLNEEAVSLFTWELALTSSRSLTHTMSWNPDLAQIVRLDAVGQFRQFRMVLVQVGEVLQLNAKKPVFMMAIPFTSMTVGVMLETYVYPYLQFHVQNGETGSWYKGINFQTTTDDTENNGTDVSGTSLSYKSSFGYLALRMMSSHTGKVLTVIGGANIRSPWIAERLIHKLLQPTVEKVLSESRITFTSPLIGVCYSLLDGLEATYSSHYLKGVYRRLTEGPFMTDKSVAAFVINRQYLKTYHGRTYYIPDDQADDCIHLLAGDYSRETFALLLSRQGISVVTSEMSITLEFGGNVFRDNCPRPVRLPLGREGSRIHVSLKGDNMVLTTSYGLRVSCKHQHDMCRISLSGNLFGHSWGLLGSNDGEPGSDFQLPNKFITPFARDFIQGYIVGGPPKCISPSSSHQTGLDEALHSHSQVLNNIQTRCSEEMANACHRQFTHAKNVSKCGSYVSPQLFLDSCLSEARSCGRVAYDACKHIHAYQYACSLKFVYDILYVNCSLESASRNPDSRRPIDIVLVVDENLGSSRTDINAHVETLLHIVKFNIHNVQLGIVGYGGDIQNFDALDPTASTRYMVTLDTLDVGADNSQWRTVWKRFPNVDTMNSALDLATSYPYRLNTQRVVIVISREENPYISDDVKSKFENLNIIVNSFGKYDSVDPSDKVNGINWDNTVIYRHWLSTYRILPLPEGNLVELVVATKGAIFNADPILERRKKRLRNIIKHIKEQIKLNNIC